jgi:CubicO group peptidase (beta-lactamase class C family)
MMPTRRTVLLTTGPLLAPAFARAAGASSGPDVIARASAALRPLIALERTVPRSFTLDERMRHHHVPGVSVAVVGADGVIHARGFGWRTAGARDAVTARTRFQGGSISKPIAATATLALVDRGALDLDRDINDYLRSWKLPASELTAREKVTLRRLLSHSAGINVPSFPGYPAGAELPTLLQVLDGVSPATTPPVRVELVPGSACRYSGGGVAIEQLALTDVTGTPFPLLVRRLVFEPLGMSDSTFDQPSPGVAATAHDAGGLVLPGSPFRFPELAAAGLWTTPTDLLRWAMGIAASRAGGPHPLLSPATATAMLTVQKRPVGLGPFLGGSGDGFNFGHPGWNPGFHAKLVYFPERRQGAAVMANGDGGRALVREALGSIGAVVGWPAAAPAPVKPLVVPERLARDLVGTYQGGATPAAVTAVVRRAGGRLFLAAPRLGIETELVLTAPTALLAVETGDAFELLPGAEGRPRALLFGDMELRRQEAPTSP